MTLTVGSLFAGIGGFDLGLERAGMRTVWFCEQDPFCQRVLAKHWPGVPCYSDVRSLVADASGTGRWQDVRGSHGDEGSDAGRSAQDSNLSNRGGEGDGAGEMVPMRVSPVDVLCGGFPCQDISLAGKGAGIEGSRSGLWSEYARLIGELRPRYVVVENVAALLGRGLDRVLGDMAALGFDAEWDCIPASAIGAPHRRDRLWIVAYPARNVRSEQEAGGSERERARSSGVANGTGSHPDTDRGRFQVGSQLESESKQDSAYADSCRRHADGFCDEVADPDDIGRERSRASWLGRSGSSDRCGGVHSDWWLTEPDVGRVANGVPARVDRLRSLGNALVPQIAEWIGRRVLEYEETH